MSIRKQSGMNWWYYNGDIIIGLLFLFGLPLIGSLCIYYFYYIPIETQEKNIAENNCHTKTFFELNFEYCKRWGITTP